jgi:hypothetical protein
MHHLLIEGQEIHTLIIVYYTQEIAPKLLFYLIIFRVHANSAYSDYAVRKQQEN